VKITAPLALCLSLGGALAAQVPYTYLVTAERTAGTVPAIVLIDPATGCTTPIAGNSASDTLKEALTIAVDPNDPGTLYANGDVGTFLGGDVWPIALTGNRHPKVAHWRPTGMPGFAFPFRFEVAGKYLLMTIQGGSNNGMYEIDIANRSVRKLPLTLPNFAADIKVVGNFAYVCSDSTATTLIEWDLVNQTARTVSAAMPQIKALGVRNGKLLAGDVNGDILFVDTSSGATSPFVKTGKGAILAMAVHPVTTIVYFAVQGSSSYEVWAHNNLTTPVYTTANKISDLDIGVHKLPSLLFFGRGCQSSASTGLAFEHVNMPGLGKTLTLKLTGAKAVSPALLLFGLSRKQLGTIPLPLDLTGLGMPTCSLYTDILVPFTAATDASGVAQIGLGIPNDAALAGVHFMDQWVSRDATANSAGWVTSDGAEAIVR